MRKSLFVLLIGLLVAVLAIAPAFAQEEDSSTYEGDYTFEIPEGYEVVESATNDLVRLEGEGSVIIVVGPSSFASVAGEIEDEDEALNFYLDRTGYTVTEDVGGVNTLAATGVSLPRRNQEGVAYLYDLGFDRLVAVIALAEEGSEIDQAAFDTVAESIAPPSTTAVLSTREDLSVLAAAVEAAGLGDALNSGEFTIFAPNNQAFVNLLALLGVSQDALLADTDTLTTVLLYHVVPGPAFAADVVGLDGEGVDTLLEGNQIGIDLVGEAVILNNVVQVIETDIIAGNSVVHVIDDVLLPQAVIDAVNAADRKSVV